MAPHIANFLLGSFGIVAAILLIGGSIVLRAQRNRHRFELAKHAIASGVPMPKGPPTWVASRRDALSILAVGIGLIVVGTIAWSVWANVSQPASLTATSSATTQPAMIDSNNAIVRANDPRDSVPRNAGPRDGGPAGLFRPLPPSPEVEAWHSAQARVAIGQTALGCGIILTILGIVRLAYTNTEKRFAETQAAE